MDPDTRDGGGKRVRWKYGEVRVMAVVAVLAVVLLLVFLAMAFSSLRRLQEGEPAGARQLGADVPHRTAVRRCHRGARRHAELPELGDSTLLDVRDRDLGASHAPRTAWTPCWTAARPRPNCTNWAPPWTACARCGRPGAHAGTGTRCSPPSSSAFFALRSRRAFAAACINRRCCRATTASRSRRPPTGERRWASVPPMVFLAFAVLAMAVLTLLLLRAHRARQAEGAGP